MVLDLLLDLDLLLVLDLLLDLDLLLVLDSSAEPGSSCFHFTQWSTQITVLVGKSNTALHVKVSESIKSSDYSLNCSSSY